MTLVAVPNYYGIPLIPYPISPVGVTTLGTATLDATGESITFIGHMLLSTGPGTSKVLSAAGGGSIAWLPGTNTFADAGSNLRIGAQDVGATGLEDGTFDVHADLVGGTDSFTQNTVIKTPMESGSKTIAHDDLVAISIELTARGGSDSVVVNRSGASASMAYCTVDTGAGPAKVSNAPCVTVVFDDGTVGWFGPSAFASMSEAPSAFSSSSTPDEHALIFRVPFKTAVLGAFLNPQSLAATDDFEVILYDDPLGVTPGVIDTITQDMDLAGLGNFFDRPFPNGPHVLDLNTDYALALRPTTTNTLSYVRINFNTGNDVLRKATPLGTDWSLGTRSNQSGAFSQDLTRLPLFGLWLGQLSDDAGGGGDTFVVSVTNAQVMDRGGRVGY